MQLKVSALLVGIGAVTIVAACGDPTALRPQFLNRDTTLTIFAVNGTPVALPSAVLVRNMQPVRVDGNFNFDLAFDVTPEGEAEIYPVGALTSQLTGHRPVGLQVSNDPYESVLRAPTTGFRYDSLLVVPVGRTVLVDVIDLSCSALSFLGQNIRAKLVVDSLSVARRTLYIRMLANANCGFRSLVVGEPKE